MIEVPVAFDAIGIIRLSVVKYGGQGGFCCYLPNDSVQVKNLLPQTGNPSYLQTTLSVAGFMDGVYESWCLDLDQYVSANTWYAAHLYSIYDEDLPAGFFEHSENLDKVNYLS